jgi:hypothetical protein
MNLVVHELSTTLDQLMTVGALDVQVSAVRPHLYKHQNPSGSLTLQILDTNKKIVASSNTIALSSIGSTTYFHGYIRFDINASLKAATSYYFRLIASGGYTFSESNYVGWANDFDLRKYSCNYTPSTGLSASLDMEIWARRKLTKG